VFDIGLCPKHLQEYLLHEGKIKGVGAKTVDMFLKKLRVIQLKFFVYRKQKAGKEDKVH
jgi:hypothetical protein